MGEGIHVIDDDPTKDTLFRCHLANEETDLTANGLNSSVLFRAKEIAFIRRVNPPLMSKRALFLRSIVLKKGPHQSRLATSRSAREKEMTWHVLLLKTFRPDRVLTHQGRRHD